MNINLIFLGIVVVAYLVFVGYCLFSRVLNSEK